MVVTDESDNDPTRFLIYLISALQNISPNLGAGLLDVLHASQPQPAIGSILTALLNEITAIPDDFIFVLDDHHVIDVKSIDDALPFWLNTCLPKCTWSSRRARIPRCLLLVYAPAVN